MIDIIKNLLNSVNHLFGVNIWVTLITLLLGLFAIVFMCLYCFMLFLNVTYRPNTPQYPFNVILDRIIPFIAICSPSIFIILLNPLHVSWIYKFAYIMIIHIFILTPLMRFWSKHRHWFTPQYNSSGICSWKNPILLLCVNISIIYPAIWGFYFSLRKYFRMGSTIVFDLNQIIFIPKTIEIFLLFICLSPHLLFWIIYIISLFNRIRNYFWDVFTVMCYSIHIVFLNYSFYFKTMEFLHKLNFIFFNMICLNATMNSVLEFSTYSKLRRGLNFLYYHPIIILGLVFVTLLLEIVFYKRIYHSSYLLFWIPIIFNLIKLFNIIGHIPFVKHVCMVDYANKNLNKLRYPAAFWVFIEDPEYFYGFDIEVSVEEYDTWTKSYVNVSKKYERRIIDYREKLLLRVCGLKEKPDFYTMKSPIYNKKNYLLRMKAAYFRANNARWFHTSIPLKMPLGNMVNPVEKFHPIVLKLCKTVPQYLALMDTSIGFDDIQKASNTIHKSHDLPTFFGNSPKTLVTDKGKSFINIIEAAQVNSFAPLTKNNVVVGDTHKMRLAYKGAKFPSMQQDPDVSLCFDKSSYQYHGNIGIDYKYVMGKTQFSGRNQVSVGTTIAYEAILDAYTYNVLHKHSISDLGPILKKCKQLARENNWSGQLDHWAENLHKFPPNWAFSLYTKHNLPFHSFNSNTQQMIIAEKTRLRFLSKKAYEMNIPEDNFQDSHIARLLAEDPGIQLTQELIYPNG